MGYGDDLALDSTFLNPPRLSAVPKDVVEQRKMERTVSMDIRSEREDLKEAAEQSLNVVLDLGLDLLIRSVSPSWKDVIGYPIESIIGKPIKDIVVDDTGPSNIFADAVESMKKDGSRSQIVRFTVLLGPGSILRSAPEEQPAEIQHVGGTRDNQDDQYLNLEGQGLMVYDRPSGGESHTMWMIRPSTAPREITIDLPAVLVESLGCGAEVLANYLTALADLGDSDPSNHPPPLPILCRICERQITPWWFEKHSELCLQEHKAEMEIQLAHEALTDHRNAIVKVLDALDARKTRQERLSPAESFATPALVAEYKGLPIGPISSPSSGSNSGRASPATPATPPRSRESSTGLGHARARSFAVRRPLSRIVELIVDLCDTAIEIKTPVLPQGQPNLEGEWKSSSPGSESGITQVQGWQTPSTGTLENEPGLAALSTDTENLARTKVEAVVRYRRILEYSERIRIEFHMLVQDCIDAAIRKAKSIKEGQLSDSSESEADETPAVENSASPFFTGSYDGPSAMATALRNSSDPSLISQLARSRRQSVAITSRSSSPMECPTPKSNTQAPALLDRAHSLSKRTSLYAGSDAGDSDTSLPSSVFSGARRTESPGSERALGRSMSSRERKRRSLKLPGMPSPNRQASPARMVPPSSPLRMSKPRIPSGPELAPSPIASPQLSMIDITSPRESFVKHHRHSSVTSSVDPTRPPLSPRLAALSHPQGRAVPTSIKDFEIIKPISKGAFGSVYLAKKKSTGDYFAIKVLKKADMIAKNQVGNVKAERAIMMWQGESDFVAKLYWTFSSKDYLYLVMEYLNGGDCASLVKILGGLQEEWAKKYLAEVILGVEHLHSRGIVHRDLKPDNLLIDQKGHLKLTDFGLSRMGLIGRQKRLLKSPNESAPDLLKHGPFAVPSSIASSRSASFDYQGNHSPNATPLMTPDLAGQTGQPSYFSLNRDLVLGREHSRRASGYRSDSGNSDTLNSMFRQFSISDDAHRGPPIEEETDGGGDSPDPYLLHPTISQASAGHHGTPPASSMLPPPMALFDPEDQNRRFVGTPDYLAPETINGLGQDEMSDWWSMGCILFEFLYGYPPFHADTPDQVFENILARRIDWPCEEDGEVSKEARDLMEKLMTVNPKERLGSNIQEIFASGGDEIRSHAFFQGINWDTLLEDEAQFVPKPQDAEDTEYFDTRGATLQAFAEELEDQASSPIPTPGAEYPDRPHDALSRIRTQVNSMKRGLMPLHIPAHVRDSRTRRLSEPVPADDFGSFAFKNLPVLEKANKDVIQKLRAEALSGQQKSSVLPANSSNASGAPSVEGSPLLPSPLKRTLSAHKSGHRPSSPSVLGHANASPSRASQPTSPLLVSFSTGQNHERRKTSSTSSSLSHQSSASLAPGSFFDPPRIIPALSSASSTSSPIKARPGSMQISSPEKALAPQRMPSNPNSRIRSQTVGSQESDIPVNPYRHHKRRSQAFEISPSSSDNEGSRSNPLLRVQRRRQSSRRMSQYTLTDGPAFRPLDVLICEDHPVSKLVMEKLLEKLRCRTITVTNGPDAVRYSTSEVQFDIIMMEVKLPQLNGPDVARMIRGTKNANAQTPIIAVTGYLKELPQNHHFDSLIEKPPTLEKLTNALQSLCQWKPPPADYRPEKHYPIPSSLRQESRQVEDSPSSQSSGPYLHQPGLFRGSSREDSLNSSFFGDADSTLPDPGPIIISHQGDDWSSGLGITPDEHNPGEPFLHPGLPHLLHHNSAPPMLHLPTPRKQRSTEAIRARRESLEKKRHECAESGDDEDDELGDMLIRPKSPQSKARTSKLGVEMMRTNSRGSVISGSEEAARLASPILSPRSQEGGSGPPSSVPGAGPAELQSSTLTPPELFPREAAGQAVKEIDMDATPRPSSTSILNASNRSLEELAMDTSPTPRR